MASRSKRRTAGARRKTRRASRRKVVHTVHRNPPAKRRRRSSSRRRAAARRPGRRHFRRNPPGLVGMLTGAVVDGLLVTGGVMGQNAVARYVPDLIPATVPGAAMLNGALKDVAGIIGGAFLAHQVVSADRARFIVAGQAHAAIARQIRAANIPTVSTMLGEYDPIKVGAYVRGVRPGTPSSRAALPPGSRAAAARGEAGNVSLLKQMGVYVDGAAPGMF